LNRKKATSLGLLYALVLMLSFFGGRAYGWYEADRYMDDVARTLGVIVKGLK
jgi:hypothetical protein